MHIRKKRLYYGWYVFAACFLMIFITLGFGSSTKSTYLAQICADLGFLRSAFTVNDALRYVTTGALSFVFGCVVSRLGPRNMTLFGFVFLILSFLIYGVATKLWHFYIGGIFLGAGFAWTGTSIVGYVVEKWFTDNKGTLMGILLAANGLGGLVSEIAVNKIVLDYTQSIAEGEGVYPALIRFFADLLGVTGWRLSYLLTALLFLITGTVVFCIMKDSPAHMGLTPPVSAKAAGKPRGLDWEGYDTGDILKKPYFYLSGFCVFAIGFILQSSTNIAKTHMLDNGFDAESITLLFGFSSLLLAFSKIIAGFMYDRWGIKTVFVFCCTCALISLVFLSAIDGNTVGLAWIYVVASPLSLPLETVIIPLLVMQLFGKRAFSSMLGYYLSFNMLGYAAGVPVVNLFYDIFGTYKGVLMVQTAVMAAVTVLSLVSLALADRDRLACTTADGANHK